MINYKIAQLNMSTTELFETGLYDLIKSAGLVVESPHVGWDILETFRFSSTPSPDSRLSSMCVCGRMVFYIAWAHYV